MEPGTSPRNVTSKRSIKYKESKWTVHEFEVWTAQQVCRMRALKMEESLLLWVGGAGEPELGAVALGLPAERLPARALATLLLASGGGSGGGEVEALAVRVAAGLSRPVFVCLALPLDRFNAPLVELGLAAEIRLRPHFFYTSVSQMEGDAASCVPMRDIPVYETDKCFPCCPGTIGGTQVCESESEATASSDNRGDKKVVTKDGDEN